jgi:two-component system, cell cycle sensor histidine kinase and response regulator CckA
MNQMHVEQNSSTTMNAMRLSLIEYAAAHALDAVITKALDEICERADSAIGFYHVIDPDQKNISLQQWSTRTTTEFCRAEGKGRHYPLERAGVWADCVRLKKPVIHNDYLALKHTQGLPAGHAAIIRELVVPVMRNDMVVAILGVGNKPSEYSQQDLKAVSLLADVTWEIIQRKKVEEALVESEKRYRRLFESAKDGILILDARTGMVVDVNPFLTRLLGYSYDELCGKHIWDIGTFKNISASRDSFRKLQNTSYVRYDDLPLETADGRIVEVEFISNEYCVDNRKVIQCNIRDMTERKRADDERNRLLAAIEQTGEMIIITDPAGAIQYVNPTFERVTGYTRQEAIGQNPRMLKSGKQSPDFYKNLWNTISGGNTFMGRMINRKKDGAFFTEAATFSPVRDPAGRIVNYMAVKRDITDQLRLEQQIQQTQKMESIGRLAGGVAHDFNNMLSIIIGYTELALCKVAPSEPLHADLERMLAAARRSAAIPRQLMAFARKQTISPVILEFNETVEGIFKMIQRLIGEDIELIWLPAAQHCHVNIDPAQIDQIMVNLCVNARDAIAGVGKLTIATTMVNFDAAYCAEHTDCTPGEFVMLAVSDDGCGMDKQTIDSIFEPFFTTKEMNQGTGLGLATVFGIVKQNNGFITVYSELGKGTTFKIYLPRHSGADESIQTKNIPEKTANNGEKVLLVEDELDILNVVRRMLESLGYSVLAADTPGKARKLAGDHTDTIHLLISDMVMPEMNGRDLADQIRAVHPEIKTLFMSGYTADVIIQRGELEASVHFIQKPFSMHDLDVKVRATLNQKEYAYAC